MIPVLPELQPLNSPLKGEIGRGQSGLAEADLPLATPEKAGVAPRFDDLVAAALPPSAVARPAEVPSAVAVDDGVAKPQPEQTVRVEFKPPQDHPTNPGSTLPKSGNELPHAAEEVEPLLIPDRAAIQPERVRTFVPSNKDALPIESVTPAAIAGPDEIARPIEIVPPVQSPDPTEISSDLRRVPQTPEVDAEEPRIEVSRKVELTEQTAEPGAPQKAAEPETDAGDIPLQDDLWLRRGASMDRPTIKQPSSGDTPSKAPHSKDTLPVTAEPVLFATPLPPKHMRADQPVADQARARVVNALPKTLSSTTPATPAPIESEPTLNLEPNPSRKVEQTPLAPQLAPSTSPAAQPAPTAQPASDLGQSTQAQQAPTLTAPVIQTTAPQTPPTGEVRAEVRIAPQIEQAIDALTDVREAARTSRPEVLMRHSEFGLVSMRLEAASGDLRATLASRDPGFVPAIQAALNERSVAASGETATSHNNQRGQDQGQGNQSSASFSGSNGGFGQNYGSSPGSSQGSPQPRMAQQDGTSRDTGGNEPGDTRDMSTSTAGGGGVFA